MNSKADRIDIIDKLGEKIEDWKNINDEDILKEAEKLIIETARKLVAVADEESEEK